MLGSTRSTRGLFARYAAAGFAAGALGGCYAFELPEGARVACTSNDDCPPDYTCRAGLDLCVSARSDDTTPAAVESSSVDPPTARIGTRVTVTLDTSEPLVVDPVVELVLGDVRRTLAPLSVDGASATRFAAAYAAAGDEPEGDHDLRAQLIDAAGNVTPDSPLGRITFDFTAPGLLSALVSTPRAKDGDTVELVVRTTEPITDASTATLVDGRALTLDPVGDDPLSRTFHFTADASTDAEGDASIDVRLTDAAGNAGGRTLDAALALDFTPPAVDGALELLHPVVSAGQVALVAFHTTEAVSDVAVELVPDAGGPTLPMTLDAASARDVSFRHEVGADDADGIYTVRITRLVDDAGNAAVPLSLPTAALTIDQLPPTFVVPPVCTPAVASRTAGRDIVTVTFVLQEDAAVTVKVGAADLVCATDGEPPAVSYTCVRGIADTDVDGTFGVSVTAVDAANNIAFASAPAVTYDFTAPVVVLGVVPDRAARAGEVLSVSAVADEALDPSASVFSGGVLLFSTPATQGRVATTSFTVPPGLEGAFDVAFTVADLGGNTAPAATRTLTIDGVAPTLVSFSLDKPRVAPNEAFTLTLTPSEALAAAPKVTFANGDQSGGLPVVQTMALTSGPAPGVMGTYVFSATGPATGLSPFYTLSVGLEDVAGNLGADSPAVIVVDNAPPRLAGFDIAPAAARGGDTVRVVITADETLAGPPVLVARNGAASVTLTPGSVAAGAISYVFTMPIGPGTAQGAWTFDAFTLTDEAGNAGAIAADAARTFVVDSVGPVISGVTFSKTKLNAAAAFTVSFTTSEPVGTPNVVVGAIPMVLQSSTGGTAFTFAYAPGGTAPDEGLAGVTISVADASGNVGVAGGDVEFDFTAPALLATSANPAIAKAGDLLTYSVTADEPLVGAPALSVGGNGSVPLAAQIGTSYVFTYSVTGAEPQGARTVALVLTDLAGNVSAALPGDGFSLDTNIPAITLLNVTPARASRVAGHDIVTTSFTLSEDVGSGVTVTLGGDDVPCTRVGLAYTCPYTVTAASVAGENAVVVRAADSGGNVGFNSASVFFDFDPPGLSNSRVTPSPGKTGDVLTLILTADETLPSPPTITTSGAAGGLVFAYQGGTSFNYAYTVNGSETQGARTTSVVLQDAAGNSATVPGPSFSLDTSVPTISPPVVTPAHASLVAGHNVVTTTFTLSENVGSGLLVTMAGRAAACSNSGLSFTCTITVLASDPAGSAPVVVKATDAAGNVGVESSSVDLDFTAPALVASTVSPAAARAGVTVSYGVTANEPLVAAPALTIGGGALTFTAQANTSYVFTAPVTGADAQGTRTVSIAMQDLAGNSATVSGTGFSVDTLLPLITSFTVPNTPLRVGALAATTFTLSENVGAGLVVTINGIVAACANPSGLNFSCSRTVGAGDGEGTKVIDVRATDAAGNVGVASGPVVFDNTAPGLLSTGISQPIANAGDVLTYTIAPSEALAAVPTMTTSGASPVVFSNAGGQYTYQYAVTGAETSGARTVQFALQDLAGNTATIGAPTTVGFTLDNGAPAVSGLTIVPLGSVPAGPPFVLSRIAGFDSVSIRFNASDAAPGALQSVVLTVAGNAVACTNVAAAYTCPYTTSATVAEGTSAVLVTATDTAGAVTTASTSLTFDYTPPALVGSPTLAIFPAAGNPLVSPTAVALGTSVNVGVTLSELVVSPPTLVATPALSPSTFSAVSTTNPTFLFALTLAGTPPQGAVALTLNTVDRVGNASALPLTLPVPGFVVDTAAPAQPAVTTTDRIVYTRAPWGNSAGTRIFRIDGAAAAVEANATVIAYNQSNVTGAFAIARTAAAANGSFTLNLDGADRATMFVAAVDAAGNSSDALGSSGIQATQVKNVSWIASMGGKIAGSTTENPHVFAARPFAEHALDQADEQETGVNPNRVGVQDGSSVSTTGKHAWREARGDVPSGLASAQIAYDQARDRVVLPGGPTGMREFDGTRWNQVVVKDPEGDGNPVIDNAYSVVYDPLHAETVLWGGYGRGETWAWNGKSWRLAAQEDQNGVDAPAPRTGATLVWDASDGVVALFSGSLEVSQGNSCYFDTDYCAEDIWVWDGVGWNDYSSPGMPVGRESAAVGFDADSGYVIIFGGQRDGQYFADTWAWTIGDGFIDVGPSAVPGRWGAKIVHDPNLGGVVMFGGEDINGTKLSDEWFFDGGGWSPYTPPDPEKDGVPAARAWFGLTYDTIRDRYVLFGGDAGGVNACASGGSGQCDDTWFGSSSSWRRWGANNTLANAPLARTEAGAAYDRTRGSTFLYGGTQVGFSNPDPTACSGSFCTDLWEWDGGRWLRRTQSGTTPGFRNSVAMAYDSTNARTVLFGGLAAAACDNSGTTSCDGTYLLNGTTGAWSRIAIATTRPSGRSDAGMAYDATRSRVVLFGGTTNGVMSGETWELNVATSTWTKLCTAAPCTTNAPVARRNPTMAFDRINNRVVLFGGVASGNPDANIVFTWDGATWTRITPTDPEGDGSPELREDAAMTYDETRRKMIYFGASNSACTDTPPITACHDTWEWNGTSWRDMGNGASPPDDGRPPPRKEHNLIYDAGRGETLLFGGNATWDTWRLDSGTAVGPAHTFRVNLSASQRGATAVRDITVHWQGGATASPTGAALNGIYLWSWYQGRRIYGGFGSGSSATPAAATGNFSGAIAPAGIEQELLFFAEPSNATGYGSTPAVVTSDYAEAVVRFVY